MLLNKTKVLKRLVNQDDIDLLKGLMTESPKAINRLIDGHSKLIYKIVYNILKNVPESQEATQDVILKIIGSADKYQSEYGSLNTWIGRIAYRTAIDYYRKRKYTEDIETTYNISSSSKTDSQLVKEDRTNKINKMLSRISPDNEQLVRLYYLEEYSVKDLARILNLSESNIKTKLFRIRKELSTIAEEFFNKEDLNLE